MQAPFLRVLSVREPYASFIVYSGKDVENREWPTNYRGPLVIHAAVKVCEVGADYARHFDAMPNQSVRPGHILGVVDLVDCVSVVDAKSPWAEGPWCFVLKNPRPVPSPFAVKGKLGLWMPTAEILEAVVDLI